MMIESRITTCFLFICGLAAVAQPTDLQKGRLVSFRTVSDASACSATPSYAPSWDTSKPPSQVSSVSSSCSDIETRQYTVEAGKYVYVLRPSGNDVMKKAVPGEQVSLYFDGKKYQVTRGGRKSSYELVGSSLDLDTSKKANRQNAPSCSSLERALTDSYVDDITRKELLTPNVKIATANHSDDSDICYVEITVTTNYSNGAETVLRMLFNGETRNLLANTQYLRQSTSGPIEATADCSFCSTSNRDYKDVSRLIDTLMSLN